MYFGTALQVTRGREFLAEPPAEIESQLLTIFIHKNGIHWQWPRKNETMQRSPSLSHMTSWSASGQYRDLADGLWANS